MNTEHTAIQGSSWEHSESIVEIAKAMNKVNARGIVLGKDAKGRFKYVSLEKMIQELLPTVYVLVHIL